MIPRLTIKCSPSLRRCGDTASPITHYEGVRSSDLTGVPGHSLVELITTSQWATLRLANCQKLLPVRVRKPRLSFKTMELGAGLYRLLRTCVTVGFLNVCTLPVRDIDLEFWIISGEVFNVMNMIRGAFVKDRLRLYVYVSCAQSFHQTMNSPYVISSWSLVSRYLARMEPIHQDVYELAHFRRWNLS